MKTVAGFHRTRNEGFLQDFVPTHTMLVVV
jgi:hypothetical protein